MDVTPGPAADRAVFWLGCNVTRHGEIIRTASRLLQAVGVDAAPAAGPAYCCGSPKEANARINEGMARRTVEAFNATGRDSVVTWCPSCHMNMHDSMAPVTPTRFETRHLTEVLHERRDALQPLLVNRVDRRVMLHLHHGFNTRIPVNRTVPDILAMIPGLAVVSAPAVPGHMCSSLVPVPGVLADTQRQTLEAMRAAEVDTLCTIFHSCHRECVGLVQHGVRVVNWMHLLAESMGWPAEDTYSTLRNAPSARAAIGPAALDAVGEAAFGRLLTAELDRPFTV